MKVFNFQYSWKVMIPANPVFFPSLLFFILLFQKPVLIAVRFIAITRTATPVRIDVVTSV